MSAWGKPWRLGDIPDHLRQRIDEQLGDRSRKAHKYHAEPQWFEGQYFRSKLDRERWEQLRLLVASGAITDLRREERLELVGGVTYRPDASYIENGRRVWEENKGKETQRWRDIKKLWARFGPGPLRVMRRQAGRIVLVEEISSAQYTCEKTGC